MHVQIAVILKSADVNLRISPQKFTVVLGKQLINEHFLQKNNCQATFKGTKDHYKKRALRKQLGEDTQNDKILVKQRPCEFCPQEKGRLQVKSFLFSCQLQKLCKI